MIKTTVIYTISHFTSVLVNKTDVTILRDCNNFQTECSWNSEADLINGFVR